MKKQCYLKGLVSLLLCTFLLTGCFGKPETSSNKTNISSENLSVEERMKEMSKKFEVTLEDYSSYYKDKKITKCLMATTKNIMYSYTEFDTDENAKSQFDEGMTSYNDKVVLENKTDKYHLYEIQQTLKTSKVNNSTIDKAVNSKETDAENVKYTTYNILEGKVIVSIMAKTDNTEDLKTALSIMNYTTK